MFQCFQNAKYVHTTRNRYPISNLSLHLRKNIPMQHHTVVMWIKAFQNNNPIILVDDEMTTGKTVLNIIRSIQQQFPREEYTIASLLDWRSNTNRRQFKQLEEELQIKIHVISLLEGRIHTTGQPLNITKQILILKKQNLISKTYDYLSSIILYIKLYKIYWTLWHFII